MTEKTAGQIVCDMLASWSPMEVSPPWVGASDEWKQCCSDIAAAVIAHVTPGIEAKARAATAEVASVSSNDGTCNNVVSTYQLGSANRRGDHE
jgi:hypothetical protein